MTTFMRVIIEGTRDRRGDSEDARGRRSVEVPAIFSDNAEYSAIERDSIKRSDNFYLCLTMNERRV
jgi:hypothetical protein